MYQGFSGSVNLTADSVVGPSGKPIRVFSVNALSGGTAGQLALRNGTTASDDLWYRAGGTANTGKTFEFGPHGILFSNGCFYDDDSNFTFVTIQFAVEN